MVAVQESTARGRIAAAAAEHGWREMFGDITWNARIYDRSGRMIVVGYRPSGAVTGATRMYATPSTPPRKGMPINQLTHLDRRKAEQVLGWLADGS